MNNKNDSMNGHHNPAEEAIPLRVLILEDDENDALLLIDSLKNSGYQLEWQRVDSEPAMLEALQKPWDIILSDYSMPGFSGTRALGILREKNLDLPFIFVSGTMGEDAAVAAMKAGAKDYVMKGNLKRLLPTIDRELHEAKLRRERGESEENLRKLSVAIAQSKDGICITDRDGFVEYVNPAFEELTGYTLTELKGKQPLFLYQNPHPTKNHLHKAPFWISQSLKVQRLTCVTHKRNGNPFCEERVISPLLDEKGEISHFVSTSRDITEKILAEEGRRRLANILEATPDVVCIMQPTDRLWYLNSAGYKTLEIPDNVDIRGSRLEEYLPQQFLHLLNKVLPEILERGSWSGEAYLPCRGIDNPYSLVILAHKNTTGRVKYLSVIARDISERKQFEIELQHRATHDALTQLPNRFLLLDRFRSALQQAQRNKNQVAVLFIDLDNFKRVNDSLGHAAGDDFLAQIAARLRKCLRPQDTVARHGGDEFTIILSEVRDTGNVLSVVSKLKHEFSRPIVVEGNEIYATFSTGISLYPHDGNQPEELLRHADTAMYKAKNAGSNQYSFYAPEMNARSREILALEAELRRAIELEEFSLFYQPQLDLRTGRAIGLEALIRWQHTSRGIVPPGEFVGLLENSGLIVPVGEWIIRQACIQHRQLREKGLGDIRISVNVSALQFNDQKFLEKVHRLLQEEDMPPDKLELEITENILMKNPDTTVDMLYALRELGVRSAIDDFGTGYSSLSYLKKFPINLLKIDQTFVRDLQKNEGDSAIIEISITLAQKLNLEIVAEGVETETQLNFLRDSQCGIAQGYFVSKPMPAAVMTEWLQTRH